MSYILGIGDEIIQATLILAIILIGTLAWWSTSINPRPFFRTVVIFDSRRQQRRQPVETIADDSSTTETVNESTESEQQTDEEQRQIINRMDNEVEIANNAVNENFGGESGVEENNEQTINIKLKYLDDTIREVDGKLNESLASFKRRHFINELAASKLIRLIFNGHLLVSESDTLQMCGLFDNCVVHCLIHQAPVSNIRNETSSSSSLIGQNSVVNSSLDRFNQFHLRMQVVNERLNLEQDNWDMTNIFIIIISTILSIAWYFRYGYSQLFTATATLGLVCLTGLFTILIIGFFYNSNNIVQQNNNNTTNVNNNTNATTTATT